VDRLRRVGVLVPRRRLGGDDLLFIVPAISAVLIAARDRRPDPQSEQVRLETAARCYEFGKALRKAIEEAPQDLRVAVVGSGGLWHTPGAKAAYLDEDFDREMLKYLEAGDIKGMAAHFDSYHIPEGDTSQYIGVRARQATGMPGFGGPQGGTRETCNWIIAAAVADGTKNVIESCLAHGVKKVVHVSSLSVVDWASGHKNDDDPIRETSALEPHADMRGHYTRSKLEAEQMIVRAARVSTLITLMRPPSR